MRKLVVVAVLLAACGDDPTGPVDPEPPSSPSLYGVPVFNPGNITVPFPCVLETYEVVPPLCTQP
jgi:hypothetical protein